MNNFITYFIKSKQVTLLCVKSPVLMVGNNIIKTIKQIYSHRKILCGVVLIFYLLISAEKIINRHLKNVGKSDKLNICYKSDLSLKL